MSDATKCYWFVFLHPVSSNHTPTITTTAEKKKKANKQWKQQNQ